MNLFATRRPSGLPVYPDFSAPVVSGIPTVFSCKYK